MKKSSTKTSDKSNKKRKWSMPASITILLVILAIVVMVTWVVPSGYYGPDGSFHTSNEPIGFFDLFSAVAYGFLDSAGLIFFLFGIGAFISMTLKTEAMEASLGALMKKMNGKEIWTIPVLTIFFAFGGTIYGMGEETLAFYAVILPVFILAGYDAMVGVFIILLGSTAGFMASTINPFSIGVAAEAIPEGTNGGAISDGMLFRWMAFFVFVSITIIFIVWYAKRVKKNKEKSGVSALYDEHLEDAKKVYDMDAIPEFTTKRKIIMAIASFSMFFMVFALIPWEDLGVNIFRDLHSTLQNNVPWLFAPVGFGWSEVGQWYFIELGVFFFIGTVLIGLIGGKKEKEIVSITVNGAAEMIEVGLVISVARGVAIVLGGKEFIMELNQTEGTISIDGQEEMTTIINDILLGDRINGIPVTEGWVINATSVETIGGVEVITYLDYYVFADDAGALDVSVANTLLDSSASALSGLEGNHYAYNILLYLLYMPLSFLIPSSSGLALTTMSIIGPLGDSLVGSATSSVTMYSFSIGFVGYVAPTSGVVMGGLALAKVPYGNYLKSIAWYMAIIFVTTIGLILIGSAGDGALINM